MAENTPNLKKKRRKQNPDTGSAEGSKPDKLKLSSKLITQNEILITF